MELNKGDVFQEKALTINREIMDLANRERVAVDNNRRGHKLQRSEHRLLLVVDEHGGKMSQKELANILRVTPAAIAVTLKHLVEMGLIVKTISKRDNRYNDVAFTIKGKRVVRDIKSVVEDADSRAFKDFTEKELDTILKFIERAKKNLSE